jgi:co-chaperonin GroES (HSP10)
MIPKSNKLQFEENAERAPVPVMQNVLEPVNEPTGKIKVSEVACCNDFVAIMQFKYETSLALDASQAYKNEGLVVGVGPGVSDGSGGRLKPTVAIGDVVMFGAKNVVANIEPASGNYRDKKIVIVSEKSIICKLPVKLDYELIDA